MEVHPAGLWRVASPGYLLAWRRARSGSLPLPTRALIPLQGPHPHDLYRLTSQRPISKFHHIKGWDFSLRI